jgi:carbon monoxide dehydrogenase subunit G
LGVKSGHGGSVRIEQRVAAPPDKVSAYVSDFRNAREWMVDVERVNRLGEEEYSLTLDSPIGKIEPGVRIVEQSPESISWVYTSTIDGGGRVEVSPDAGGCLVTYAGDFHLKHRFLDRAARFVGVERFARTNGERSLARLKYLMEAGRY